MADLETPPQPPAEPAPAPTPDAAGPGADDGRIAVLGLGRGGGRIVECLAAGPHAPNLDVAAGDTDLAALEALTHVAPIPLGREWTRHAGCGGDAALGEKAAGSAAGEIRDFLGSARLVLVAAGLGGGTGSGAARAVARLVRERHLTAVFLFTVPFSFEGVWRRQQAETALESLRSLVDIPVVLTNDQFFRNLKADTPAGDAFAMADRVLADGLLGLSRLAHATPLLPLDLANLRTLLKHPRATCSLAVGRGSGPDRGRRALDTFFASPFLGGREALASADGALLILFGDRAFSIGEVNACSQDLTSGFAANARVVMGAYADAGAADELVITGVICSYSSRVLRTTADAAPAEGGGRRRRGAAKPRPAPTPTTQGELPLQEMALGCFSGSAPTMHGGENLDIPTFQRRGVVPDLGD